MLHKVLSSTLASLSQTSWGAVGTLCDTVKSEVAAGMALLLYNLYYNYATYAITDIRHNELSCSSFSKNLKC